MHNLIAEYLYQYNKIYLPDIGTLALQANAGNTLASEQVIESPYSTINFENSAAPNNDFISYVAATKKIDISTAENALNYFCRNIIDLKSQESFTINNVGSFTKQEDESLSFSPTQLPTYYRYQVKAERVTHPDDTHEILVGDRNTDSATMKEYLTESDAAKQTKWWLIVSIILIIAASALLFYFYRNGQVTFGLNSKIETAPAQKTHTKLP